MSTKIMITYKRKHGTSRAKTIDGTVPDPSAVSSSVVTSSLARKDGVDADNNMLNADNSFTSAKQQDVLKSVQGSIKQDSHKQCAHGSEKEQKELQLCESSPRKEQSEICCATSFSIVEACKNTLQGTNEAGNPFPASSHVCDLMQMEEVSHKQCAHGSEKEKKELQLCESSPRKKQPEISCAISFSMEEACKNTLQGTNEAGNPVPASSPVCDLVHDGRAPSHADDSNNSAPLGINSHQGPNDTTRPSQCKTRFSPLLTFRRRVKNKDHMDKPVEKIYPKDSGKQCSTLTRSPPSSSVNATLLLKETDGITLDTEDKVTAVGTRAGPDVQAKHLLEQKSSHILKSTQPAEDVNQGLTPQDDCTPVSDFMTAREISEAAGARVENSCKTPAAVTEVREVVEVKEEEAHDDPVESEGSTKNIPIVVLDGDGDERTKELENSKVIDQVVQEKNKSRFALGQIDLNRAELPQEKLHIFDESSVQKLPEQVQFGNGRKQVSQPIERLFFTKEKDNIHRQHHNQGTSTMHTLYSNFFDPTPSWDARNFKEPSSMPSELKFKIMDRASEFNLDLSLDSFPDSLSSLRPDKYFRGGTSSGSHLLTERLGIYSYKRHSVPWSEEELDFLWIGVRRYGTNNWNAMLRDTRLQFSNTRMPEDLAKQWDKEQKKLIVQSINVPGPSPSVHIGRDYVGNSSCSGCSKSPFLPAQTDLSLGDLYLRNARASERGQHHLSNLGIPNFHGIDSGARSLSLGGFPEASSSYGRSNRRRRASKFYKSQYADNRYQKASERVPQLLTINQQQINNLPQWLTKGVETGTSRLDSEMWPSMHVASHSAADPPKDSLRGAFPFPGSIKPHVLPDASLKRTLKRKAEWHSVSKKLFRTDEDASDQNQRAAAMAGPNGATASDTGASSEGTVSDS